MPPREQFGSSSRYRTFVLCFGKTDGWWGKYLTGYTHVFVLEQLWDGEACLWVGIDFERHWCPTFIFLEFPPTFFSLYSCLRIKVRINRSQDLFKLVPFQTCATLTQSICGFNCRSVLANTLYKALSYKSDDWLAKRGIIQKEFLTI